MKYLVVRPLGGLANRMRVLESAYSYSKNFGSILIIIWERNEILNARFSDCFSPIEGAKMIETNYNGTSVFSKIRRAGFDALKSLGLSFFVQKRFFDTYLETVLTNGQTNEKVKEIFDELAIQNQGIFLETCYEWYPNTSGFRLNIQENIKKRALASLNKYSSVVGLHIRRTDNIDSINQSPLEKFIEQINTNLERLPSSAFYLSTDSDEVVHELKEIFPNKIITGVSVRSRDSKEGIESALVDLYCLSQCEMILGSFKSSFSERAAIIGNIPLQIVSV